MLAHFLIDIASLRVYTDMKSRALIPYGGVLAVRIVYSDSSC